MDVGTTDPTGGGNDCWNRACWLTGATGKLQPPFSGKAGSVTGRSPLRVLTKKGICTIEEEGHSVSSRGKAGEKMGQRAESTWPVWGVAEASRCSGRRGCSGWDPGYQVTACKAGTVSCASQASSSATFSVKTNTGKDGPRQDTHCSLLFKKGNGGCVCDCYGGNLSHSDLCLCINHFKLLFGLY